MKIDIETVARVLRRVLPEDAAQKTLREITVEAQGAQEEEEKLAAEEEAKEPAEKKKFVVVRTTGAGTAALFAPGPGARPPSAPGANGARDEGNDPRPGADGEDEVGFVFQVPESLPPGEIFRLLQEGAKEHNGSRRGRRHPVSTIGELCEFAPAKVFTNGRVTRKSKEAVVIVTGPNELDLAALDAHARPDARSEEDRGVRRRAAGRA